MSANRLFIGVYPCGLVYADRSRDYKRLAFLSFATLQLDIADDCAADLCMQISGHANTVQVRKGQLYEISECGQTVRLGGAA